MERMKQKRSEKSEEGKTNGWDEETKKECSSPFKEYG